MIVRIFLVVAYIAIAVQLWRVFMVLRSRTPRRYDWRIVSSTFMGAYGVESGRHEPAVLASGSVAMLENFSWFDRTRHTLPRFFVDKLSRHVIDDDALILQVCTAPDTWTSIGTCVIADNKKQVKRLLKQYGPGHFDLTINGRGQLVPTVSLADMVYDLVHGERFPIWGMRRLKSLTSTSSIPVIRAERNLV